MASRLRSVVSRCRSTILRGSKAIETPNKITKRTMVCKESGAILPEPQKTNFGLLKVAVTVSPFLCLGAVVGEKGAVFLEDSEIFVPSDDDD